MDAYVIRTAAEFAESIFLKMQQGSARIGWSYRDDLDLEKIISMPWQKRSGEQGDAWYCHGFVDRAEKGDLLFYPNVPEYGKFAVVKLTGSYQLLPGEEGINGDFRSARSCNILTSTPLDKYDEIVAPSIRNKLGLQRRFYHLNVGQETLEKFLNSVESGAQGRATATNLGTYAKLVEPFLKQLGLQWSETFPRANLSYFLADILSKHGEQVDLREGAGEKGSDLVIEIRNDFLERPIVVGIQAMSCVGEVHADTVKRKLEQLLGGWEENILDYGALVLTGNWTDDADQLLASHNRDNPMRRVKKVDAEGLARIVMRLTWIEAG